MTNTVDIFTTDQAELLRNAALKLENWDGFPLRDDQADFLGFLLRSIANERDYKTVKYRALQAARALVPEAVVASPAQADSDVAFLSFLMRQSADMQFSESGRVGKILLIKATRTAVSGWEDEISRVNAVTRALGGRPDPGRPSSLAAHKYLVEAWLAENGIEAS